MYINNKLCQIARDDRKREEDAKEAVGKSKGKKAAGGKPLIFIKLFFIKLHLQSDQCFSEKNFLTPRKCRQRKGLFSDVIQVQGKAGRVPDNYIALFCWQYLFNFTNNDDNDKYYSTGGGG